jgi:predicted HTH transcriptional regulator
MTEDEFEALLAPGHEQRGVEFKGPGRRSDRQFFARVARAVLGMANRRDGGVVVIGVEDKSGTLKPVGLSVPDLATWKYDDIADSLAVYADPSVSFDLEIAEYKGSHYVILSVDEFEDVPVLCNKPYPDTLRNGACYVRSRRKPETSEIPSQADMRDLIELATEKRLRRFVAQARAAGLDISGAALPTDEERFENQQGDLR